MDGRSENKEVVAELTQRYGIERVAMLAYHLQINGIIKKRQKPIINTLSKMPDGKSTN